MFAFITLFNGVVSGQDYSFRVVRGKVDTTYSARHYVVGVAKPGSTITINGEKVKQYETGGFGIAINLSKGNNRISVKAIIDNNEVSDEFSVFYKDREIIAEQTPQRPKRTIPVISTLKGAYLNSSAGTDRLGGTKINYIAEGVKMELLDSIYDLYKVRLSEERYSYIPKSFVKREVSGTIVPFSVSSSISVSNVGGADMVMVALEGRHPYIISRELNPNKIVIDLHGVQCNSNWLTHYLDLESVDYVESLQSGSDVLSIVIHLKESYSWGYSVDYSGNSLVVRVKHSPKPTLKGLIIGLDAGHGGTADGAVSITGVKEKALNLEMTYILKEEFEKRGAKVVMTRTDDRDLSMQERIDILRAGKVNMALSVHCNAGGSPLDHMGASTYYKHVDFRELAKSILVRIVEIQGVKNFGLVGNFNFSLSSHSDIPIILVETMFLSSLPDEEKILNQKFRKEMMLKVVQGVEEYMSKSGDIR